MIKEYLTHKKNMTKNSSKHVICVCALEMNIFVTNHQSVVLSSTKRAVTKMFRSGMRYALTWVLHTKRAIVHNAHTAHTHSYIQIIVCLLLTLTSSPIRSIRIEQPILGHYTHINVKYISVSRSNRDPSIVEWTRQMVNAPQVVFDATVSLPFLCNIVLHDINVYSEHPCIHIHMKKSYVCYCLLYFSVHHNKNCE